MLKDKLVLITGASSGIGAACAKQFAEKGAKLLLCARRLEILNKMATQYREEYGVDVCCFRLDVRHYQEVTHSLKTLPTEWQPVDILVNNAGLAAGLDTLQEGDIKDWDDMIDTNVKGLLYVTKGILQTMLQKNSGHIINIGSIAGHYVYPKGIVYCATKYAVNALSNGLRMDLFGKKIRVTTIDPGAVETNFSLVRFKGDAEKAAAVYAGLNPLTAEDVADAVMYAATRPEHVNISEIIIMPTDQAHVSMFYREKSD
jgi:3-hydroxy acid dehydrogenase / malonic semialdehyde reductase